MNHSIKKLITMALCVFFSIYTMSAETFIYQNVCFRILDDNHVEVTNLINGNPGEASTGEEEYFKYSGNIIIPEKAIHDGKEYTVIGISRGTFHGGSIESIELPNTLESISKEAFESCYNLKTITIPASVKEIGEKAFAGTGIEESAQPMHLTSIDVNPDNQFFTSVDGILYNKDITRLIAAPGEIESVVLPESVKEIAPHAFHLCYKLKNVKLSPNLEKIGKDAFSQCVRLEQIELPPSVKQIGVYAFSHCDNLKSAILSDSLTEVPEGIFYGCRKLETVALGSSIKKIGDSAFEDCESLNDVLFPPTLEIIEDEAFLGCESFVAITLPDSLKRINGRGNFIGCPNLTVLSLPRQTVVEGQLPKNTKIIRR